MSVKDNYYTLSEAAKELDVTRQTIFRWIKDGKISGEKVGRETLLEKGAVIELQREQMHNWFNYMAGWYMKGTNFAKIREHFGYTEKDKIEIIGSIGDLQYLVTKENGERKTVIIDAFSVGFDKKTGQLISTIQAEDIYEVPYEETKAKKKSKKVRVQRNR